MPIAWTGELSPVVSSIPLSKPNRLVTAAATRNRIRPRWLIRVAIFVQRWRSPYRYWTPSASASRMWKCERRNAARTAAASTPVTTARSGRIGSKNGSGWTIRISDDVRHSLGVRFRVHTMIEVTSRIRSRLNHQAEKMLKICSRSRIATIPDPSAGSYLAWMISIWAM